MNNAETTNTHFCFSTMNIPCTPKKPSQTTNYWFSRSTEVINRILDLSPDDLKFEWRNDFRDLQHGFLADLPAGQVVVVELSNASSQETSLDDQSLELSSKLLESILCSGNDPTIVCLGHNLPAAWVVDWIRRGIFTYAEADSTPQKLISLLHEADQRSRRTRLNYQRLHILDDIWKSLNDKEVEVLDMLFEGVPNKMMAARLQVSQRTIESRRQRLFQKFQSKSLPNVVRKICEWKHLRSELLGVDDADTNDFRAGIADRFSTDNGIVA